MKFTFKFIVLFVMMGTSTYAQNVFPESWLGNYKGDLNIYGVDSIKMKAKMNLDIVKTPNDSIFDWTITYEMKGKKNIRAYSLIVVDRSKGHYQIDEKNTIIIDGYLHNTSVFTSFFKVSESYIIATYTKQENEMLFEIIAGKGTPVSTTGNTKQNDKEIPVVYSYLVNGRQKAVLRKEE